MSFRQFPATGSDGNPYIIIEFHDAGGGPDGTAPTRYELADGQRLQRREDRYTNADATLVLVPD